MSKPSYLPLVYDHFYDAFVTEQRLIRSFGNQEAFNDEALVAHLECNNYFFWCNLNSPSHNHAYRFLKAIRWMINTRPSIFAYELKYAKMVIPYLEKKLAARNRRRVNQLRFLASNRALAPKKPAKNPFCEEKVLHAIFERQDDKALVFNPNFEPKIGIELEVENIANGPSECDYCCNGCTCECYDECCSCECSCECDNMIVDRSVIKEEIWDIKEDGSLYSSGREFVCVPLEVDRALDEFDKLATYLRNKTQASGEETCGLHFHVGIDPQERDVVNPYKDKYYQKIEDSILSFIHSHRDRETFDHLFLENRYGNDHCRLWKSSPYERYRAVNFNAIQKHGTIEIRFCGVHPTFSPRWILQFRHFVTWVFNLIHPQITQEWVYEPLTYTLGEKLSKIGA